MTSGTPGAAGSDFDWSWTEEDPTWVPPEIDTTRPSPARMYDYALGGKDNFQVDREAVEQVATVLPDFRRLARDNRGFLVAAVERMSRAGIRQFLDLGTGIPTSPNVHEVSRDPERGGSAEARIVYVDNDPIVMAHNRALQAGVPGVVTVQHDLRSPGAILDDPRVRGLLDLSRPVGVLAVAVLHFVRRDAAPEILTRFRRALAPGSHLAISVATTDGTKPEIVQRTESVYERASSQIVFRSASQIERLFDGFEILDPGLRDVSWWRDPNADPSQIRVTAAIGRVN